MNEHSDLVSTTTSTSLLSLSPSSVAPFLTLTSSLTHLDRLLAMNNAQRNEPDQESDKQIGRSLNIPIILHFQ